MWVNVPAIQRRVPASFMSFTRPVRVGAVKPDFSFPSERLIFARLLLALPATLLKKPPANTDVPSGATTSEDTSPSGLGTNVVLTAPVVALNATRLLRL